MKKLELWRRRAHHGATPSTPGAPAEPGATAAQAAPAAAPPAGRSAPPSADEEDTVPAAFYHSPD